MAITDSIGDMLTVIRNGSTSKKNAVEIKNSGLTENILKLLKKERFISAYKLMKDSGQGTLRVYLKYGKDGTPAIMGIKRVSRPGLRIYKRFDDLPKVYGGLGLAVISTSKGLLTDNEAREKRVGGEVLCYVW